MFLITITDVFRGRKRMTTWSDRFFPKFLSKLGKMRSKNLLPEIQAFQSPHVGNLFKSVIHEIALC